MKKTWTTRILIALLTLAIVGSVFGVAPKVAHAEAFTMNGPSTLGVNVEGDFYVLPTPPSGTTYYYKFDGDTDANSTSNIRKKAFTSDNYQSYNCTIYADAAGETVLGQASMSVEVTSAPTIVEDTIAGAEVGKAYTQALTVTGFPVPTVTISGLPSGLYQDGSSIKGTPTTMVTNVPVTVTATNKINTATKNYTLTVAKGTGTISITSAETSVARNGSIILTAKSNGDDSTIQWKKDSATGPTIVTGPSYTYAPASTDASPTSIYAVLPGTDNLEGANANKAIQITASDPRLSISPASSSISYGASSFVLSTSSSSNGAITWHLEGVGGLNTAGNKDVTTAATSVSYIPPASGSGTTNAVITATQAEVSGTYVAATATASVTVSEQFNVEETALTPKMGSTAYPTFTVVTSPSGNNTPRVVSNKTSIATVELKSGPVNGVYTYQVKPVNAGDTTISVYDAANALRGTVPVHVASSVPIITTSFVRAGNPTPYNLTQVWSWGQLVVTVKDYNTAYPYVTLTRSNIRTYVQGGSYYSHPSTYTYTAYLSPAADNANNGVATLNVLAQYNGSTYYTVAYTGASSVNTSTIYVSGFTTLPQTGPNYIWAYVLGGLCLVTVATAVTLNVRKKKRESI